MSEKTTFIPLHNRDCTGCGHLVSHAKSFHDNCHYSNGNDNCPAKVFKIGVGVNVEKASQAIADSFFNADTAALQRHFAKLGKYDPVQIEEVTRAAFQKLALHHGIDVTFEEEAEDDAAAEDEDADDFDTDEDAAPVDGDEDAAEDDDDGETEVVDEDGPAEDADADSEDDDEDAGEQADGVESTVLDDVEAEAEAADEDGDDEDGEEDAAPADGGDDDDDWNAE